MTSRARIDGFIARHKRPIAIIFCAIAVLLTAMAWGGVSLKDVLAALRF